MNSLTMCTFWDCSVLLAQGDISIMCRSGFPTLFKKTSPSVCLYLSPDHLHVRVKKVCFLCSHTLCKNGCYWWSGQCPHAGFVLGAEVHFDLSFVTISATFVTLTNKSQENLINGHKTSIVHRPQTLICAFCVALGTKLVFIKEHCKTLLHPAVHKKWGVEMFCLDLVSLLLVLFTGIYRYSE